MINFMDASRIDWKRVMLALLCLTLVFGPATATFDVEKVQAAETKVIRTAMDLHNIRHDVKGNYVLANDINLNVAPYNTGPGWDPIDLFEGTFDGKNYKITGLMIDSNKGRAGLFGDVSGKAKIANVHLIDVNVKAGHNVGALVGHLGRGGLIENVTVTGKVSGPDVVGGVAGYLTNAKIKNSHANVTVTSTSRAGGLISSGGGDEATIENSTSKGTVSSTGRGVGGLAGEASIVINSSSSANVTSTHNGGTSDIGGLVGRVTPFRGEIKNSFATGNVHAQNGERVGGLVGVVSASTTAPITNSYATGTVTASKSVGGLVGTNNGVVITDSYATGEVYGVENVGGLIGYHLHDNAIVQKSYSTSAVIATGDNVGGLIGQTKDASKVIDTYARGSVAGNENVGGLIGFNPSSTVERSYATGEVTGVNQTGGLIGQNVHGKYSPNAPNYYDSQTTGQFDSTGGTGLLTAVMTDVNNKSSTYKNWNFKGVWDMEPNDYPVFALFADINELAWAKEVITEATAKGYFSGYSDGTFRPNAKLTRMQSASLLVRALDLKSDETSPFTDIGKYAASTQAEVNAAYKYGLVVPNVNFMPERNVTRAQIALMLKRAYEYKTGQTYTPKTIAPFSDIAGYDAETKRAITMLYELGIAQGSNGKFMPSGQTTRAHAAKMLVNFMNELE